MKLAASDAHTCDLEATPTHHLEGLGCRGPADGSIEGSDDWLPRGVEALACRPLQCLGEPIQGIPGPTHPELAPRDLARVMGQTSTWLR